MWSQLGELAANVGPWFALVGLTLFFAWTVILVREFTRGHLARSDRPFTVKLWGLSIVVGSGGTDEATRTVRNSTPSPDGQVLPADQASDVRDSPSAEVVPLHDDVRESG
jgi:hypothetical protein